MRPIVALLIANAVLACPASAAADPLAEACTAVRARMPPSLNLPAASPIITRATQVAAFLRKAENLGFNGGANIEAGQELQLRQGYGFSDRGRAHAMPSDAIIDLGSVSKQFTAAGILKLQELGKLRVHDPIGKFFDSVPSDKQAITIHQLLTHTAGFPHDAIPRDDLLGRKSALSKILASPLQSVPGSKQQYSNAGYTLLAAIIEIASGEPYEAFLRRTLWLPSGMRRTGNLLSDWPQRKLALAYYPAGEFSAHPRRWWIADGPSWSARGAGYILSTPDDMLRWAHVLRTDEVLGESSRRALFYPHVQEGGSTRLFYGYGWGISLDASGSCVIEHDGGAGFHYSVLMLLPDDDASAFLFTTEYRSPASGQMDAARRILKNRSVPELPDFVSGGPTTRTPKLRPFVVDGVAVHPIRTGPYWTVASSGAGIPRVLSALPPLTAIDRAQVDRLAPGLRNLFASIRRGDFGPLSTLLSKKASLTEERQFWSTQWSAWEKDLGAFRSAELIGHRRSGDLLKTYVHLRFAKSALPIEVWHLADGIYINTVTTDFPERYVLMPTGERVWSTYNSRFGSGIKFRLDGRGRLLEREPCFTSVRCWQAAG